MIKKGLASVIKRINKNREVFFLFLFIYLLWLFPHVLNLGDVSTVDEPTWISRSSNFFDAVRHFNFDLTYQAETATASHPGVTTMIMGSIGVFLWKSVSMLLPFLDNHVMLFLIKLPFALIMSLLFAFMVYLVYRLTNKYVAFLFGALCSLDPFMVGTTRILHLDGLLSLLMFASIMTFYISLTEKSVKLYYLSAIIAGLAVSTKIPAFAIFPFIVMLTFFIRQIINKVPFSIDEIKYQFTAASIWTIVALSVLYILWPALWIKPYESLFSLFGAGKKGILFAHDTPTYQLNPFYYIETIKTYSSPLVLFLFGVGLASILYVKKQYRLLIFVSSAFILYFVSGMTLGAKKSERYIMPVYPYIYLVGSIGFVETLKLMKIKENVILVMTALIILPLLITVVRIHPHYQSYYNPLVAQPKRWGLGEGIELAAEYLNKKPHSERLVVAAWYDSSFALFFRGKTRDVELYKSKEIDYIVTYRNMLDRPADSEATTILQFLKNKKPEKVFYINGMEYVWVYNMRESD